MKIIFSSFKFLILNFCNENHFFIFQILDFSLLHWKLFFHLSNSWFRTFTRKIIFHHSNSWFWTFALNILFLSSKFFIFLCCIEHHFLHFCSKHNFFYPYKFLILQWKSFFHLSNSSFCNENHFFIIQILDFSLLHWKLFFHLSKFDFPLLHGKSFFHHSNSWFCPFALNILFLSSKFFIFLCCIEHHFLHFCSKHNFFYLYKFLILQWKSFFHLSNSWFFPFALKIIFLSFKFLILHFYTENHFLVIQILDFALLHWIYCFYCYNLTFRPGPKILFQGNTPEGSDTFQRPVIERDCVDGLRLMIWDKGKVLFSHYSHAPEESNLWTAWQLFPLDDD